MKYIYVGKIVNTHGIKGEVRMLSNFRYKDDVFKLGNNFYIGNDKQKQVLSSYRVHKNFDMVTFEGINNINDVLKYKGEKVYIDESETEISGLLDEDIIGMEAYFNDKFIGLVEDVRQNPGNDLLVIGNDILIPYIKEFVSIENSKVILKDVEGLL